MEVVKDPDNDQIIEEMVTQYQRLLLHLCYVRLRDQELARDAVQETFLKAYRSLHSFRGECSPKTWLIQIALNTCKSIRRSAWQRHHDRRITPEDLPERMAPVSEDSEIMCEIMMLPCKLREVILLYYWQDMNISEIAQILGIANSTVSRRLTQSRKALHDMLLRRNRDG